MRTEYKQLLLINASVILLVARFSSFAADPKSPGGASIQLLSATADQRQRVLIQVRVSSANQPIIVPVCDRLPDGTESPCMIEVQAKTVHGWRLVQPKRAKLGMVSPDLWNPHLLQARTSHDFSYGILRHQWKVTRGERVRVVVWVWKDEQAMRSMRNTIKLKTRPFACP
jgi:hypothetical protein